MSGFPSQRNVCRTAELSVFIDNDVPGGRDASARVYRSGKTRGLATPK